MRSIFVQQKNIIIKAIEKRVKQCRLESRHVVSGVTFNSEIMNTSNSNDSNKNKNNNNNDNDIIFWKVDEKIPNEICIEGIDSNLLQPVLMTLIPRTIAWFTVNNEYVSLLDGYTATCYTPPSIHFAANSLPKKLLKILKQTKKCSLSAITIRDSNDTLIKAACKYSEIPKAYTFEELNLNFINVNKDYPPTLDYTPIRMHCTLENYVTFDDDDNDNNNNEEEEAMIVLTVENFVVDGSVLSSPTESMIKRNITAKIDAELIQPLVSFGNGNFVKMKSIKSMPRPKFNDDTKKWTSTELDPVPYVQNTGNYKTIEWNFRIDGSSCPLGFNPTTALIMPRPIGWISTYTKIGNIPHLAPYSFFIDITRGKYPKVAFSAFRTENGNTKKDAQKNAEETGYFCYNTVTEEVAIQMNYSAAELSRIDSEFKLSNLDHKNAKIVNAPYVKCSKIIYECQYIKTIDVASFSIVIGEVKAISIHKSILSNTKTIDLEKLRPIARLGYMDEYGLFF